MPRTMEVPQEERKTLLQQAPPAQAVAIVESEHSLQQVADPSTRLTIGKSNEAVSGMLSGALRESLKVAKNVLGSVGQVFTVFGGLKRIFGGI